MVQGRLFRGSQENSPEGTPLPSRGGVINPVLALWSTHPDLHISFCPAKNTLLRSPRHSRSLGSAFAAAADGDGGAVHVAGGTLGTSHGRWNGGWNGWKSGDIHGIYRQL